MSAVRTIMPTLAMPPPATASLLSQSRSERGLSNRPPALYILHNKNSTFMGRTLVEKLWDEHTVADLGDGASLLFIDRIFLHERMGSVSLKELKAHGRPV